MVVVRRRPAAVALVAVQSLILAALALSDGIGHSTALAVAGAALALALVVLLPPLGLPERAAQDAAAALLAIGVATARVRRAAIFQALGFLVAENGVYAAALGTPDGLPALIVVELAPQAFARGGRLMAVGGTVAGGLLMAALAVTVGV